MPVNACTAAAPDVTRQAMLRLIYMGGLFKWYSGGSWRVLFFGCFSRPAPWKCLDCWDRHIGRYSRAGSRLRLNSDATVLTATNDRTGRRGGGGGGDIVSRCVVLRAYGRMHDRLDPFPVGATPRNQTRQSSRGSNITSLTPPGVFLSTAIRFSCHASVPTAETPRKDYRSGTADGRRRGSKDASLSAPSRHPWR